MAIRKARFSGKVKRGGQTVLGTLLPAHSLITGRPVREQDQELWQHLVFLDDPCCHACGFPFEYSQGEGALCLRCEAVRPAYGSARAAIEYSHDSRKIILDFKHGGRTDGLTFFARQMHRAGEGLINKADFLVPVPLHTKRLRTRKFNQAALLARALCRYSGADYDTEILHRLKNSPSQGGKSFLGRKRNVSGAFGVTQAGKPKLKDVRVLLIDDVYTTGATLNACARVLKQAGAARVDALTLMRVVSPVSITT